jgi:hypothetical protein
MGPVSSGTDAARHDVPSASCGQASSAYAQRRIAQLLGDAVSHLISAGLDLASVRGRISRNDHQIELEHATNNLDAAMVDIRRLAVGIALGVQTQAKDDR